MISLRLKALKDEARVLGLVLSAGYEFDLDAVPAQAPDIMAAVDAGDVSVLRGLDALKAAMPAPEPKAAKK